MLSVPAARRPVRRAARRSRRRGTRVALDPEQLIRADAEIELRRRERLHALLVSASALGPREFEAAFDALEAELPFNCEHVVPQSWFAKHEPMRGDLHHLFACEPRCNSFRGNTPYADFADDTPGRCPRRLRPQRARRL